MHGCAILGHVGGIAALMGLLLPIGAALGAVIAWRKRQSGSDDGHMWHDDSLDDWRRERDAAAEAERATRSAVPGRDEHEESRESQGGHGGGTHTRLGG